jgi:hypothetical protein
LIATKACKRVRYCVEAYSGDLLAVTAADILGTIGVLSDPTKSDVWSLRHFGEAIAKHILEGEIIIDSDKFWSQPTPLWELPDHFQDSLKLSDLVIIKGERLFNRCLGHSDIFESENLNCIQDIVAQYWIQEAPLAILYIFESDFGARLIRKTPLSNSRLILAENEDIFWMNMGMFGVALYCSPKHYDYKQ